MRVLPAPVHREDAWLGAGFWTSLVWDAANIYQSLLAPNRTDTERQTVRARTIAFTTVLREEWAAYPLCLYDDDATFNYQFSRSSSKASADDSPDEPVQLWTNPDTLRLFVVVGGYCGEVTTPTQQLAPALDIDTRLTEIERALNLLLNITPVNAAEAWTDFERGDFGTAPTLRLRPLEFEPDMVRRDLYSLEIENVTDPALHTLFRAKRDEIARQITALEDRDTSRFVYGSLQLYGGIAQPLASAAEELLETIPAQAPSTRSVTAGAFAEAARAEFDRYRAVYPDFPAHIEVRDDISELMVSFGRLLIPEAATIRADRVEPLLHHEVGTHVVTYHNGARQPLTLLTIGLPGYDETQEGLAVLAEYLTGGLDPRRLRVLAARVVAIGQMLDGAGFLDIFESLRSEHRIPTRTAWSIAIRVVVGGGSVKDAIYLRGITRILEALVEGSSLDVLFVGKLALDHIPLIQDLLDRNVLEAPWVRPRWLDVPGAQERLDRLRAGASVTDLYEGDVSA